MARVPNWGPRAGQPVPDEDWDAYRASNPPPEGASFSTGPAVQPAGSTGAALGPYAGDAAAAGRGVSAANVDSFWSNYFSQGAQAAPGPRVGYDTTNADQARGWQQQIMQDLQRQAAGDPNSRAQQSLTQGYGAARAGQSALGSAARGTGGAAGLRAGAMGAGNVQRGYVGDQQMLMQQEKQGAQALLAQQLAQMRGLDAGQAAGMAANAQGNQSLEDAMRQFYESQGLGLGVAEAQRGVGIGRARAGIQDAQTALGKDILNSGMQAGATGLAALSSWGAKKPETTSDSSEWQMPFERR